MTSRRSSRRADRAGGQRGTVRRDPGPVPTSTAVAPDAAGARPPLEQCSAHRPASTTSTRVSPRPARTRPNTAVPQAYYNSLPRHHPPHHRDRRRPVGHVAGRTPAPSRASSARSGRFAPRFDTKAVAPPPDGGVRRHGAPVASRLTEPGGRPTSTTPRLAGHRDHRGRRGRSQTRTASTPSGRVLNHVMLHQTVDRRGGAAPASEGG